MADDIGDRNPTDWILYQQVLRDILLLFHQLSDYLTICGHYGYVFDLPYWEYLNFPGELEPVERAFIRDGCLVMILSEAWDSIDGASYFVDIPKCRAAIDELDVDHPDTERFIHAVGNALDIAEAGGYATGEVPIEAVEEARWAHRRYVQQYFRDMANAFPE
jgi:hypothetical protein